MVFTPFLPQKSTLLSTEEAKEQGGNRPETSNAAGPKDPTKITSHVRHDSMIFEPTSDVGPSLFAVFSLDLWRM